MALRGVQLQFPTEASKAETLLCEARLLRNLELLLETQSPDRSVVALAACPERHVEIRASAEGTVFISTLFAPTLYELLWKAVARLGATPASPFAELPTQLTVP